MNCTNCGAPIYQGESFCTRCGTPVSYSYPEQSNPVQSMEASSAATKSLVFGILSLAIGWAFGFVGIIFAAVAKSNAKNAKYYMGGITPAKAKVGNGLAIPGLILSIIMTVYYAFIFLAIFAEML